MIYFETDILRGLHKIQVKYQAIPWVDESDWIRKKVFRYALSPANYWKSFGQLHLVIDALNCNKEISVNLPAPIDGDVNKKAVWKLNKLPVETIEISYAPPINNNALKLLKLGPGIISVIIGIILVLLHLLITYYHRKINPGKNKSIVVIIGSLVVPVVFLLLWIKTYDFIDWVIGPDASGRHGYLFLKLLLYPIILPIYWWFIWLVDKSITRHLNNVTME